MNEHEINQMDDCDSKNQYQDYFYEMKDMIYEKLKNVKTPLSEDDVKKIAFQLYQESSGIMDEWLIENLIHEQNSQGQLI